LTAPVIAQEEHHGQIMEKRSGAVSRRCGHSPFILSVGCEFLCKKRNKLIFKEISAQDTASLHPYFSN
jgi:hypothetical protein